MKLRKSPKQKVHPLARSIACSLSLSLGIVGVAHISFQSVHAADEAWSTVPAAANFSGINWTSGQAPGAASTTLSTGDSLYFGTSTLTTLLNDNSAFTYAGLTFNSGASAFVIGGNSFTLSGGITNNSTSIERINTAIALAATQTINTNTGTIILSGIISGTGFGLTKTGSGLLVLTGASTYTGATTISGGTIGIVADNNLGASAAALSLDGGTLKVAGGSVNPVINTHALTITANGGTISNTGFSYSLAATLSGGNTLNLTGPVAGSTGYAGNVINGQGNYGTFVFNGTSTFSGTINVGSGANVEYATSTALSSATLNINSGGRIEASSGVTVSNSITVADGGSLGFQNANTGVFSGTITLSGGTANVHMFDWYNYGTARSGTISGKITGAGGLNVFAVNGATLTASGANDYTGATSLTNVGLTLNGATGTIAGSSGSTLLNATITLDYSTANVDKLKDTGAVTLGNNSFIAITPNATTNTTETMGALGLSSGNGTVTVSSAASRVTMLAAASFARGSNFATALIRGTNLNQSAATNVSRITLADGGASLSLVGTNTLNGGATNDTTQALKIVPYLFGDTSVSGTGGNFVTYDSTLGLRVLLTGEQTTLTAGYATATNHDNAIAAAVTLSNANVSLNSLLFNSAVALNGTSTILSIDSGAIASTTGTTSIGSGVSSILLANGEGVLLVGAGTLTINAPINVTSNGGLTKGGAGAVTLTAANVYTGQTTINQGTLTASTTNNIFNGTSGTAFQVNHGATFAVGTTTQAITSLGLAGSATVSGSGGTLNLGGDITYDGSKNLNSVSTISVSTLNLNGTRTITAGDSLATLAASTTNMGAPDVVISSVIADGSAASGLTKEGAGTVALTGANTFTGTTTINSGTLLIGSNGTTGSLAAAGTIVNNGTLGFSYSSGTITQGTGFSSGPISGTGGITNFGAGAVVLNAANTFSGAVNILNGTVSVSSVGNSGSSSNLGTNGTINLGNVGGGNVAVTATLLYTGSGETTDKVINLTGFGSLATSIIDASGAGLLKFTNSVTGVDGSKTLTLQGSGAGEMSGALNDLTTGILSLTKSGSGTWTLSANNTFTGATTVNGSGTLILSGNNVASATTVNSGGILQLKSNANALTGSLTLNSGSTLQLRGDVDTTFNTAAITINSDPSSGADTTSFTIDVNAATAASNKTLTMGGAITMLPTSGSRGNDSATINVNGASGYTLAIGTVATPGNGSGSNVTFVPASGLTLSIAALVQPGGSNPGAVTFSGAGNTIVTGSITKATNRSYTLNFNQTGTVTLNSAATSGGGTGTYVSALNAGTIVFNNAAALNNVQINLGNQTASSTAAVNFLLGGGTGGLTGGLTHTAAIRAYDTTSGKLTIGGQNTSGTNTFSSGAITLGNTANTGKSVNLVAAAGGQVDFTGVIALNGTDTTAGVSINDSYIVNAATVTPMGTVRLAGANTYRGLTTIVGGTLLADSAQALNTTALGGSITFTGGTLKYGSAFASGANADISARIKNSTSAISIDTNAQSATYATTLDNTNTGGLTKKSNGALTLSGANAYTGATTVTGGTLKVTGSGTLGSTSNDLAVSAGATLDLDGTSQTVGALSGGGTIDNVSSATTNLFTMGNGNATGGDFSGSLKNTVGTLSVTKTGSGTQILSGGNTYGGTTTVDAGTLLVSGSIAGSVVTVNNSGTLGGAGGTTGAVTVNSGGTLSPGASVGTLHTAGDATFNSGSTFKLEINTTAATTDLLDVQGFLNLGGSNNVVLNISDLAPAAFTSGSLVFITYTDLWDGGLFKYGGTVIGDGDTLFVGSNQFALDYDYGGNSVALIAVPEPNAIASLFGGFGMLVGLQRFRRRKA